MGEQQQQQMEQMNGCVAVVGEGPQTLTLVFFTCMQNFPQRCVKPRSSGKITLPKTVYNKTLVGRMISSGMNKAPFGWRRWKCMRRAEGRKESLLRRNGRTMWTRVMRGWGVQGGRCLTRWALVAEPITLNVTFVKTISTGECVWRLLTDRCDWSSVGISKCGGEKLKGFPSTFWQFLQ